MFQGVAVSSGSAATGAMRPADASPHFSRGGAGRRYFSGDFGSVQYGARLSAARDAPGG